ncbi:hypothetical protein C9374_003680 [Naegleria lovaniensis]|uniref:F-box domain-containing protein n=1 Tax=Naegleria lovaniensis TaxID=51637 RepID=A0AA88H592_NAELO|nr:uncharacterized protein C9374_003680 [Naegleria lovaniensis]KAG2393916.1 hypothetical protein C9374_003680 [Naegleria lovaniensis]
MSKKRSKSKDAGSSLADLNLIRKAKYLKEKEMLQDLENAKKRDVPIQYITLIKQYDDGSDDEEIYISLDCMLQIFSYLTPSELLLHVGLVCKSWYFLSIRTNFLWQNLYYSEFGDESSRPVYDAIIDENDDSEFDGQWKKVYGYRVDLRNKWYNNHPDRIGYLDILHSEYARNKNKNTNKGELFKKDAHLACISEEDLVTEDASDKKLYRIDPADRAQISTLCLVGSDRLLSGDARGVIKLFNLRSYQQVKKFVGAHDTSISNIVCILPEQQLSESPSQVTSPSKFKLDPNCTYFLSTSLHSCDINVWQLETGLLLKKLRGEHVVETCFGATTKMRHPVVGMKVSKFCGQYVLVVVSLKTIEIYDLTTFVLLKIIKPFYKPKQKGILQKKLIDAAIEKLRGEYDSDEEEQGDDEFDDDTMHDAGHAPATTITKFEVLDDNNIAIVSGDQVIRIYNMSLSLCIKAIDMKKTKVLDIENYNRPTSLESFKKLYRKFSAHEQIIVTGIYKTNIDGQFCATVVIGSNSDPYNYAASNTKTFIKYFDYRFGIENPVRSVKLETVKNSYDYYGYGYSSHSNYFDDDKIIISTYSDICIVGRKDGIVKQSIQYPLNLTYNVSTYYADERFLIIGTSFGGIIALDFGGNLLYWSNLKGRTLLDETVTTSSAEQPVQVMDESQD